MSDAIAPLRLPASVLSALSLGLTADADADADDGDLAVLAMTIDRHVATLVLEARQHGRVRKARGWLDEHRAVLAFHEPGDEDDPDETLVLIESLALPALLSAVLGVGARPRDIGGGVVSVRRAALERYCATEGGPLAHTDAADAYELDPDVPEAWMRALTSPSSIHWWVEVVPRESTADDRNVCEVVDGGEHGLLAIDEHPDDEEMVLAIPASSTVVWGRLSELLPDDDQLGELAASA